MHSTQEQNLAICKYELDILPRSMIDFITPNQQIREQSLSEDNSVKLSEALGSEYLGFKSLDLEELNRKEVEVPQQVMDFLSENAPELFEVYTSFKGGSLCDSNCPIKVCLSEREKSVEFLLDYHKRYDSFLRVRIGKVTFYFDSDKATDEDIAQEVIYEIYLYKLLARCFVSNSEKVLNKDLTVHEFILFLDKKIRKALDKNTGTDVTYEALSLTIRNILYYFIKDDKNLWDYIDELDADDSPSEELIASKGLIQYLEDSFYKSEAPSKQSFETLFSSLFKENRTRNKKQFFIKYIDLITNFSLENQKEDEEEVCFGSSISKKGQKFDGVVSRLISDRFSLPPYDNSYFFDMLFWGTCNYLLAGGRIQGVWGAMELKGHSLYLNLLAKKVSSYKESETSFNTKVVPISPEQKEILRGNY